MKNCIDEGDRAGLKEIAMPVYLKSKAEKHEHSGQVGVTGFNFISNDKEEIQNKVS